MLLSPDSQFFRYFNDAFGKTGQMGTGQPTPRPSSPTEKPSAPSDGDGDTMEQGAAGDRVPSPEHDVSVGGALPQAPQTP